MAEGSGPAGSALAEISLSFVKSFVDPAAGGGNRRPRDGGGVGVGEPGLGRRRPRGRGGDEISPREDTRVSCQARTCWRGSCTEYPGAGKGFSVAPEKRDRNGRRATASRLERVGRGRAAREAGLSGALSFAALDPEDDPRLPLPL